MAYPFLFLVGSREFGVRRKKISLNLKTSIFNYFELPTLDLRPMSDSFKFEELIVYQKSLDFIDQVYLLTNKFPKEESFRLTSQFIRAAHSVALNIADGSGGTNAEFRNYLRISKRSARECIVCITIAIRQKYLSIQDEQDSRQRLTEISKMLNGLINSIK